MAGCNSICKQSYFKKVTNAAIDSVKGSTLFPSLAIAQGALESDWGRSGLASKYNNFFGIKKDGADRWTGRIINLPTKEEKDGRVVVVHADFRWYEEPFQSFYDRRRFLEKNPRYRKNGVFSASTPEEQAWALQRAGYATDSKYAEKLISTIKANNLKKYDGFSLNPANSFTPENPFTTVPDITNIPFRNTTQTTAGPLNTSTLFDTSILNRNTPQPHTFTDTITNNIKPIAIGLAVLTGLFITIKKLKK